MKESELKPGQVAVNSHGCILVASNASDRPAVSVFDKDGKWLGGTYVLSAEKEVTLLGPITNLDDLPVKRMFHGYCSTLTDKAVLVDDLTGRCLTRSEGEGDADGEHEDWAYLTPVEKVHAAVQIIGRCVNAASDGTSRDAYPLHAAPSMVKRHVDTLTARVAELEKREAVNLAWADCEHWKEKNAMLDARLREVSAELATLREQCVLGEELTLEEFDALSNSTLVLVHGPCTDEWAMGRKGGYAGPGIGGNFRYWLWTPPVLPEPEPEVPEVPPAIWEAIRKSLELELADDEFTPKGIEEVCNAVCSTPELIAALSGEGANKQ